MFSVRIFTFLVLSVVAVVWYVHHLHCNRLDLDELAQDMFRCHDPEDPTDNFCPLYYQIQEDNRRQYIKATALAVFRPSDLALVPVPVPATPQQCTPPADFFTNPDLSDFSSSFGRLSGFLATVSLVWILSIFAICSRQFFAKQPLPDASSIDFSRSFVTVYQHGRRDPVRIPLSSVFSSGIDARNDTRPSTPASTPAPVPVTPPPRPTVSPVRSPSPSPRLSPDSILPRYWTPSPRRPFWLDPRHVKSASSTPTNPAPPDRLSLSTPPRLGSPFQLVQRPPRHPPRRRPSAPPSNSPPSPTTSDIEAPSPVYKPIPDVPAFKVRPPQRERNLSNRTIAFQVIRLLDECHNAHNLSLEFANGILAQHDLPPQEPFLDPADLPSSILDEAAKDDYCDVDHPLHPANLLRTLYQRFLQLQTTNQVFKRPNTFRQLTWRDVMGSAWPKNEPTPDYARQPEHDWNIV